MKCFILIAVCYSVKEIILFILPINQCFVRYFVFTANLHLYVYL